MAYAPYTSATPNTPVLLAAQPIAWGSTQSSTLGVAPQGGGNLWIYGSTHTVATVATSDFISDGRALGMKANDLLIVNSSVGTGFTRVTAVGSTYVSLSLGLLISSAS